MKKPAYFVQYEGPWVYVGRLLEDITHWIDAQIDMEDDDEIYFKCAFMTDEEIEALPEADL